MGEPMGIDGYPDYFIDDLGQPYRRMKSGRLKPIRPTVSPGKQATVTLYRDGIPKKSGIAHLVLSTFIGPCPPGHIAFHFPDRDPANNRLSNLRWAPKGTDIVGNKGWRSAGRRGEFASRAKLGREDVARIRSMIHGGFNGMELAELFGVNPNTIYKIVHGRTWKDGPGLDPPPKGRYRGEARHSARLSERDVPEIFRLSAAGLTMGQIGERFGVTGGAIHGVLHRNTWRHVEIPPEFDVHRGPLGLAELAERALREAGEPMRCKEIAARISGMIRDSGPSPRRPAAGYGTVYSSMERRFGTFRRTDRGLWSLVEWEWAPPGGEGGRP